jgi:hypothetical protein
LRPKGEGLALRWPSGINAATILPEDAFEIWFLDKASISPNLTNVFQLEGRWRDLQKSSQTLDILIIDPDVPLDTAAVATLGAFERQAFIPPLLLHLDPPAPTFQRHPFPSRHRNSPKRSRK